MMEMPEGLFELLLRLLFEMALWRIVRLTTYGLM